LAALQPTSKLEHHSLWVDITVYYSSYLGIIYNPRMCQDMVTGDSLKKIVAHRVYIRKKAKYRGLHMHNKLVPNFFSGISYI
jgi:hypothetical protein